MLKRVLVFLFTLKVWFFLPHSDWFQLGNAFRWQQISEQIDSAIKKQETGILASPNPLSVFIGFFYEHSKSLFLWVPILFGLGIGLYFMLPYEPPLWMLAILALFVSACLLLAHLKTKENISLDYIIPLRFLLIALSLVGAGIFAAQFRTLSISAPVIDRVFETPALTGVVEKIEMTRRGTPRFIIKTQSIAGLKEKDHPSKVALLRYGKAPLEVREGDYINVRARLEPSYRPAYPGAYDPAFRDFYKGIGARGRILGQPEVLEKNHHSFLSKAERLRSKLSAHIVSSVSATAGADGVYAMGPFVTALITGKRGSLDTGLVNALRDSGLAHILAISGLHMALFTGALFWLVRGVMALFPQMVLTHPIKKYASVFALMGGIIYLVISGAPISAQRAFIMAAVMFVAILVDRHAISLHNLAIAAMAILIIRPESILSISFQMSFASVGALIAFYEAYRTREIPVLEKLGNWQGIGIFFISIALTTIIATLATAPFVSHYFGALPSYGLLANLLIMPIFTVLTMPLALLAFMLMPLGLSGFALELMGQSLFLISEIALYVSSLKGSVVVVPQISFLSLLLFVGAGVWLILWQGWVRALFVVPLCLGLIAVFIETKPDVLISERGRLIAVKEGPHRLGLSERGSSYVARRWLQFYGDERGLKAARKNSTVKCDGQGCAGSIVRGGVVKQVALVKERSILTEECYRADVLIVADPVRVMPKNCPKPQIMISRLDLWKKGAHALWLSDKGEWHMETASSQQGERPWNRDWQYRNKKR